MALKENMSSDKVVHGFALKESIEYYKKTNIRVYCYNGSEMNMGLTIFPKQCTS